MSFVLCCAAFTFLFLAISNYCKKKDGAVGIVITLWMLSGAIGLFILSFILSIAIIDELESREGGFEPQLKIEQVIWWPLIFLIVQSIVLIAIFSDLKLYFEKMLYNDEFIFDFQNQNHEVN